MKKKNVLLIMPTPPPYMGPSVASKVILNSNLREHFNLILLDTADRRSLSTLGKFDIINLYHFFRQFFLLFYYNLFFKIDLNYLLLTQTRIGIVRDFIFYTLLKVFRRKVLFHFRGSGIFNLYDKSGFIFKFFIEKILVGSSGVIFLCERLKNEAKRRFPGGKYFVLFNGKNVEKVHKDREKFRNILFLSNLKEEKGVLDLLKSIPEILKDSGDVKFFLVGKKLFADDGDISKIIEDFKENIEIHTDVYGKEKEKFFKMAHLFILPSYNEGMPWAIVEALGYSLPVISTHVGCIPEMVFDGENGFLIEPGDIKGLIEKILLFSHGEVDYLECGKISREIYEKRFNVENFILGLKKIFEEVMR